MPKHGMYQGPNGTRRTRQEYAKLRVERLSAALRDQRPALTPTQVRTREKNIERWTKIMNGDLHAATPR